MLKLPIVSTNCLAVSLAGLIAFAPAVAWAEDPPKTKARAVPVDHGGEKGVWFPSDMARDVLQDVEEVRVLRGQVVLYDMRIDIEQQRIATLKEALRLSMLAEKEVKGVVEQAVRGRREAEEAKHNLFSGQPGIWASVGVVLGIVTTVVVVSQVK